MDCEKMYEVFDIPYLQGLSGMYLSSRTVWNVWNVLECRTMHVLEYSQLYVLSTVDSIVKLQQFQREVRRN